MRVVCWNLERKRPATPTGAAAIKRMVREDPELAILTEARVDHMASLRGYEMCSQPPVGARFAPDERTVIAWSRNPWRDVDMIGDGRMPPGRFVAGTTSTSIGDLRVVAICIPWHMCDVQYGSKDRKPWEQHLNWLELFQPLIERAHTLPVVIAGDFNQRVPRRSGTRKDVAEALAAAFAEYEIVSAGVPPGCQRQGIDHVAIDDRLKAECVRGWPNDDGGVRMSDHDAVVVDLVI